MNVLSLGTQNIIHSAEDSGQHIYHIHTSTKQRMYIFDVFR